MDVDWTSIGPQLHTSVSQLVTGNVMKGLENGWSIERETRRFPHAASSIVLDEISWFPFDSLTGDFAKETMEIQIRVGSFNFGRFFEKHWLRCLACGIFFNIKGRLLRFSDHFSRSSGSYFVSAFDFLETIFGHQGTRRHRSEIVSGKLHRYLAQL